MKKIFKRQFGSAQIPVILASALVCLMVINTLPALDTVKDAQGMIDYLSGRGYTVSADGIGMDLTGSTDGQVLQFNDPTWESTYSGESIIIASATATAAQKSAARASGGSVCDGTADQVEINAAIAAMPYYGWRILLMSGTYTLSAPISITGNKYGFTIEGQGFNTVITLANNANCNVITYGDAATTYPFNATFKNFTIDGNKTNNATGGYGIEHKGWQCNFQHLSIGSCKAGGIHSKVSGGPGNGNRYEQLWMYDNDNYGFISDADVTDEVMTDVYVSSTPIALSFGGGWNRLFSIEIDNATTGIELTDEGTIIGGARVYARTSLLFHTGSVLNVISGCLLGDESAGATAMEISEGSGTSGFSLAAVTLRNVSTLYGTNLTADIAANPSSYAIDTDSILD